MEKNKKVIFGLAAIAFFVVLAFVLPNYLTQNISVTCTIDGQCMHEQQLKEYISLSPLFVAFGFLLGALAFYFIAEMQKVERVEIKPDKEVVLRLLDGDERKIVSRIVEEGGRVLQSELSYIEGIGKVRAHRVIKRLMMRGVVEKESHGKTNLVKLTKEMKSIFSH